MNLGGAATRSMAEPNDWLDGVYHCNAINVQHEHQGQEMTLEWFSRELIDCRHDAITD